MNEWIKIEEVTPEIGKQVMLYHKNGLYCIQRCYDLESIKQSYTYWMRLPEPPEEILKCPLCEKIVEFYPEQSSSNPWINCHDCRLSLDRLEPREAHVETKQELINRWERLGGGK